MNFGSRSEKASRRIAQMEADLKQLQKESEKWIGELYAIEAEIRGMPAKQRFAERQQKAKPRLKSLESWL
ncbi:hypothetical protein DEO48_25915 [Enterobacter sp. CGMCC 5087]|nr:hypothetical protein DEO48_25915 [Enterobacter sp. CGMCC 5087]